MNFSNRPQGSCATHATEIVCGAGPISEEEPLSFDPIALIEKAYEPCGSHASWLETATGAVAEALDPSFVNAISYVHGNQGPEKPIVVPATAQMSREKMMQMVAASFAASTPQEEAMIMAACRKPGITSLRQVLGDAMDRWLERRPERSMPFVDAVAVTFPGPDRKPVVLSVTCTQPRPIQESETALWHRIAVHLSAGWRLVGRPASTDAEDVEAVLTADGRVAHASGAGTTTKGRELLRAATQSIDRARSRGGRNDPAAALDLWQGLLAGRWSLVEHFDSDGRRFMLARRNDPGFPEPIGLSRRQRQVLFYASLGLANKEIAYALGLAENTISAHLASGLARLRIKSRAELICISSELTAEALPATATR